MSIEEMAVKLAQSIKHSKNKEYQTGQVLNAVYNLTDKNGNKISNEIKLEILETVYSKLEEEPPLFYLILEKSSNQNYLIMLSSMIQILNDEKNKKSQYP